MRPHRRQPTRLLCPWDSPGKNTGVGCHFLLQCMKVKSESEVTQSCPTLPYPMDCSLPGSSIHGIFQARVLEWGAITFSLTSSQFGSVQSLSRVRLLGTPWTAAYQAPPSMGFSKQEYWSGVPLPSPKCPLGISNFLEEISSLSHSVVSLYFFALITEEGFLISSCYSLDLCIQMLISFLLSFAFHFSSLHSYL